MKKTFSKAELKTKAEKAFKDYPNEKKAFATVDGNIFFSKNHAGMHAGSQGTIYTFEREVPVEETAEDSKEKSRTAKEVIAMIEGAVTKEELEAYGFEDDERTTVKAAYAKKLEDFNQDNK